MKEECTPDLNEVAMRKAIVDQLNASVKTLDELSIKRLEAVRKKALKTTNEKSRSWQGYAAAAVLAIGLLPTSWYFYGQQAAATKMDSDVLGITLTAEDLDDLDMLMGLEDVES